MNNPTVDTDIKALLAEIANTVVDLPNDLRPHAFSTLLNHRLQGMKTTPPPLTPKTEPLASGDAQSVGEFLSTFKGDLREDEKLLAAISFTQAKSEDNTTSIETAHTSLKDIGIKLSNAGVFGKQLLKKKLIFATGKAGKVMKLRVSVDGTAALQKLMSNATNT